jgi:hypothetical protein
MSLRKTPRNIFQTWETKVISEDLQKIINTWKEHNPEYKYVLYDNQEREEFIQENFEERVYNVYCKIIPGAYKADLWRYCVLYIYGGVYADIDTICMAGIDSFVSDDTEFMTTVDLNTSPYEGCHNLSNTFILSTPNHPILLGCINRIVSHVENNIIPPSKLDFAGPGVLGRETNIFLNLPETASFIGKEGQHGTLSLLVFEHGTEYITDTDGNILLQNKNGNKDIVEAYNKECMLQNTISWLSNRPF